MASKLKVDELKEDSANIRKEPVPVPAHVGDPCNRSENQKRKGLCKDSQTNNEDIVEEIEEGEYTKKGSCVLDEYISDEVKAHYHVLQQGDDIYDATLNFFMGNTKKFHIIQALESNDGSTFVVYNRWGRVGLQGQDTLHGPYTCVDSAVREFKQKFHEKCTKLNGYEVLKRIADVIDQKNTKKTRQSSKDFYTISTPHHIGLKESDTPQELKFKLEMVESLGEIEVARKLMDVPPVEEDPLLSSYERLHCDLTPIEVDSKEYHMIKTYMKNTHGETHSNYSVDIVQIFKASRHGEVDRFSKFSNSKNRLLLWHGSPIRNWVGILSEGLRIPPRNAPRTHATFGKGVYFADMFSKSAKYCRASEQASDGLLLLCEVALGEMNELQNPNRNAHRLPRGKLSTKGVGATAPDMSMSETLEDGVVVPLGHPKKLMPKEFGLLYNEYVVYNVNQIRMRYVVHVKCNYEKHVQSEMEN